MRRLLSRTGSTLLAVMLALVLLATMGAALAQRALAHVESSRTTARSDVARAAAQAAVVETWRAWDGVRHASDSVGEVVTTLASADSAVVEVTTYHGDARLWWIAASAWTPGGAGTRLVTRASALAVWLRIGAPAPQAAVAGVGVLTAAPSARIVAAGAAPAGWNCPSSVGFDAVVLRVPARVLAPVGVIVGPLVSPPISGLDISALWIAEAATIAAAADVQLPRDTVLDLAPGTDSTDCSRAGWGEPLRQNPLAPCLRRFATVYAAGQLTLRGRGQGVLLVDGPLVLDDSALFAGLVIARGTVRLGVGARVSGALVLDGTALTLDAGSVVDGAGCVLRAALRGGTLLTEVPAQAWYTLR